MEQGAIEISSLVRAPFWTKFLRQAGRQCSRRLKVKRNVSVVIAGDVKMKKLNKIYRLQNRVTDVLSFGDFRQGDEWGEIVICLSEARRQAARFGVSLKEEMARLLIHGLLHLQGFHHEKSARQADKVFKRQEKILCSILKKC